jgi:hypothetical protein
MGREDEAAPVLLDLYRDAVVRPVREVAFHHALASPFPLDQTSQDGAMRNWRSMVIGQVVPCWCSDRLQNTSFLKLEHPAGGGKELDPCQSSAVSQALDLCAGRGTMMWRKRT